MKDRIKLIIETENLSYSKFADMIGIQRSGISHIINGRNKPSLELVQKVLETFKYINTDWLLFGKGNMKNVQYTQTQGNLFSEKQDKTTENEKDTINVEEINSNSDEIIDTGKEKNEILASPEDNFQKKRIDKIVILYSDKSFSEYHPE